ncbi:hypothetical protein CHARACLAT_015859 [Characodon lateralis]|uniref:Uncharacterized protein n=1 Tax=Characodon lateralis TaxID=208331 RepID=A0ABU7EK21_9TELE|nr:hypothetical protein [Characodon lateralis]
MMIRPWKWSVVCLDSKIDSREIRRLSIETKSILFSLYFCGPNMIRDSLKAAAGLNISALGVAMVHVKCDPCTEALDMSWLSRVSSPSLCSAPKLKQSRQSTPKPKML